MMMQIGTFGTHFEFGNKANCYFNQLKFNPNFKFNAGPKEYVSDN